METCIETRLEGDEKNKIVGLAKLAAKTNDEMPLLKYVQQFITVAFKRGYNIGRDHGIHHIINFTLK